MKFRHLAFSIILLAASMALPYFTQPTAASSPMMNLDDLVSLSDTILTGTVKQVLNSQIDDTDVGVHTDVIIQPKHCLYGQTIGTDIALYQHGGVKGSQIVMVPGQVEYTQGEDVLLFLFRASPYVSVPPPSGIEQDDYYMTTGGNLGKWNYADGTAIDFKGQTYSIEEIGNIITAIHGAGSFNNIPTPSSAENPSSAGQNHA
jgi:hypothetical protein